MPAMQTSLNVDIFNCVIRYASKRTAAVLSTILCELGVRCVNISSVKEEKLGKINIPKHVLENAR